MKRKTLRQPRKRIIFGQPSWRLLSDRVEAYVTELGGHIWPVAFDRNGKRIQPYSIAPWAKEKLETKLLPMLRVLRGDFFCLPFGANTAPFRGERHPPHGETANRRWTFESFYREASKTILHLSLKTRIRRGRVDKRLLLNDGHDAIYVQHVISGMAGPMTLGHHAMLRFPDAPGSGVVSTSPFLYGQVFVEPLERPENRGYSILKPGAEFNSLERVRTVTGELADLSRYPARRGYEDLVMLVSDPQQEFVWTAVTFPSERVVWFALKDPRVLRQTIFWFSNGGRHYTPWNGRHVNVMGLEEVTSYFHVGLAESVDGNPVSAKGDRTCLDLKPARPLVVHYIMAAVPVPRGFDRVVRIEAQQNRGMLVLKAASGAEVMAKVNASFLQQGNHVPGP